MDANNIVGMGTVKVLVSWVLTLFGLITLSQVATGLSIVLTTVIIYKSYLEIAALRRREKAEKLAKDALL